MKKFIILAIFLASMVSASMIAGYHFDKAYYEPGDSGTLTISILFTYSTEPTQTLVDFSPVSIDVRNAVFSKTISMPVASPGLANITIPFTLPKNISNGQYETNVRVSSTAEIWEGSSLKREIDFAKTLIPLKIIKQPVVGIKVLNPTLHKEGSVTFEVCSLRSQVKNLQLTSSTIYINNGILLIGSLEGCENITTTYDAKTLTEGTQDVPFMLTYKNVLGDEETNKISLPLTFSFEDSRFTLLLNGSLQSKGKTTVKMILQNNGRDVQDVRVILPSRLVGSEGEIHLGDLSNNMRTTKDVGIYTSLPPSQEFLTFLVKWKEDGKEEETTLNVPVNVEGDNPVNVYLESNELPLRKGSVYSLSTIVANKASYDLSGVSVTIFSNWLDVLNVESSQFIGSLTDNDFSSQQFKVKVKDDAPDDFNVTINIKFNDPSGATHTKTVIKSIHVQPKEAKEDKTLIYGFILLVIAGGAYYLNTKRK